MNITLDKQSATDGLLKIQLTESDYQPKVEETMRDYARKVSLKGFRQGKVPAGVIKKIYGKEILVDEVNRLISVSVSDYVRANKLNVLGDPLPNHEKVNRIDWDFQKEFEFEFQIGFVEDFTVDLSKDVKVTSHSVEVGQKEIDEALEDIKRRHGKHSNPEVSGAGDNILGEVVNGSGEKQPSYVRIDHIEKEQQQKFIGLKKGDVVEFEVEKILTDTQAIAQLLNVSEKEAKSAHGKYSFKLSSVFRMELAIVNQALFDQVFGKGVVTTEEEFIHKLKERVIANYGHETQHMLNHEIRHYYVDHTKIDLPDGFLKTWLKAVDDKVTDEMIDKEFNSYCNGLKWDLIKNKIVEEKNIKVESGEVHAHAKQLVFEQYGGASIADQLGDEFDVLVSDYLMGKDGKGENFMRSYNQLLQDKTFNLIKENITVQEKKMPSDEFRKLFETHRH